jgi:hypothetical protein
LLLSYCSVCFLCSSAPSPLFLGSVSLQPLNVASPRQLWGNQYCQEVDNMWTHSLQHAETTDTHTHASMHSRTHNTSLNVIHTWTPTPYCSLEEHNCHM